jgi:hypothetical protein
MDAGLEDLAARGASQVELDVAFETFQAIEREMAEEEAQERQQLGMEEITDEIHGLRLHDDDDPVDEDGDLTDEENGPIDEDDDLTDEEDHSSSGEDDSSDEEDME